MRSAVLAVSVLAFGCASGEDTPVGSDGSSGSGGSGNAGMAGASPWPEGGAAGSMGGGAGWPPGSGGTGQAGAGSGGTGGSGVACTGTGPAYVHGDLWAYWHNGRVACDSQRKWLWACEQRLGAGNCPEERSWFDQCWSASGGFPPTGWVDSQGMNYPAPHSANYGVCQPAHFPEKNDAAKRPANAVPCDATTFDYDALGTVDRFYGNDWWDGGPSMRHLTLKVFEAGVNPLASEGKADGIVNLSTHPGEDNAFMEGLSNHTYAGAVASGGCMPSFGGDKESPMPDNNFGAFFWLEVPTDRPVTIGATWMGKLAGNIGIQCIQGLYFFPPSFSGHSVDGKPWFIQSPCFDILQDIQLEPGRHYVWDVHGFRQLPDCAPPEDLLMLVDDASRPSFREGTCSSM